MNRWEHSLRVRRGRAWNLSPEERLRRFAVLQTRAMAILQASPEGWRRFLERNYKARRVHGRS